MCRYGESQSTAKAAAGKADGGQKGLLWVHLSGKGQLLMKAKDTFTLSFNGKISLPKQNSN